jgi:large subunit ribosomal protein L21
MYAVFESGGKQHRVQPGDILRLEKLEGEVGTTVKFDRVLMTSKPSGEASQVTLGKPLLQGATVEGEIVGQGRGEKILIIKMKRRKQYRRTQGHRQFHTEVLVTGVSNGAGEQASLDAAAKKEKLEKFFTLLRPVGLPQSPKAPVATRVPFDVFQKRQAEAAAAPAEKKEARAAAPKKKKAGGAKKKKSAAKKSAGKKKH